MVANGIIVDKIKKDLIHKAKVKKAYKKIKTTTTTESESKKPTIANIDTEHVTIVKTTTNDEHQKNDAEPEPPSPQLHPERQAMLDGDVLETAPLETKEDQQTHDAQTQKQRQRPSRFKKKPGYFDKALTIAEQKKAEVAERAAEQARREAEWKRKREDRERYQRAMAKARKPGRDGQRRVGRESGLLLEKVRKMVG